MEKRSLRVTAVNAAPVAGDVIANVRSAAVWCERAAEVSADLVLFPEAWTTGYDSLAFAGAIPLRDDVGWLTPLQRAVDQTGVVAVVNSPVAAADGHRTLTSFLLSPGRERRPAYDKQHLFGNEKTTFRPGEQGATFMLRGHRIAMSVCYDVDFPEHVAAAAAAGATVYLNSGAYFAGSEHRRDLRYAARALDNGMYVVFSGLTGSFVGGSAVYDPFGEPVARLGTEQGLVLATLDPGIVDTARASQCAWADRRADLGHHQAPALPLA